MIYLDTSAAIKLAVEEAESSALIGYLASLSGQSVATSTLGVVELRRVGLRLGEEATEAVEAVVRQLDVLELSADVMELAGTIPPSSLRTLDAIHVATALTYRASSVITYDQRMAAACEDNSIHRLAPANS